MLAVAGFDRFEKYASVLQTGVGRVAAFGFVAHSCAVAAACVGCEGVGSAAVPGETHEDGACAAVVVGGLGEEGVDVLFYGGEEGGGDGLRHGFFVLWVEEEEAGCLL